MTEEQNKTKETEALMRKLAGNESVDEVFGSVGASNLTEYMEKTNVFDIPQNPTGRRCYDILQSLEVRGR